jgi:hypothetical protein
MPTKPYYERKGARLDWYFVTLIAVVLLFLVFAVYCLRRAAPDEPSETDAKLGAHLVVGYMAGVTLSACDDVEKSGRMTPDLARTCAKTRADLKRVAQPLGVKHLGTAF